MKRYFSILRKAVLFTVLVFFLEKSVEAQQLSFPGAEGAGRYTSGGRGSASVPTTVFEVTNLNDDGLPGSLRYAVNTTATYRTIVFRISGTIHLGSKLNIRANTTLAGQTAPGDGICIADYPVVISGDNVIVRYMRFRMGDKNQLKTSPVGCGLPVAPFTTCSPIDGSGGDDALGALGASNIIIDHCSVSWSSDEALTIYRGDNLTIQWSMISEPLNYSYHFETGDTDFENHGYGGIWGAKNGSMHHNLIASCRNRNPRFAGISTYTPNTVGVENVDFWNNVIYNWGINTVYGGEGGNYNIINNYYKWGPNTGSSVKYRVCNPSNDPTNGVPFGKWYVDGNYVDGSTSVSNNNWSGVVMGSNIAADTVLSKVIVPFDLGYTTNRQAAVDAYDSVLKSAGCVLPNRDTLDQRIIFNVKNRTGAIIDVQGGYAHGTPYLQTTTAWPVLNTTTAPVDTDHDGMPDAWETANGLNPNDAADRNVTDASGYTKLEVYINNIKNENPQIAIGGSLKAFSQLAGIPSAVQTYTVSGSNLTDNITILAPAGYEISANGSSWYSNSTPLVLTGGNGLVNSTTISVRLNTTVIGTYSGNIIHSSTGALPMYLPVTGAMATVAPGLGSFPEMDGGFENQPTGAGISTTTHSSTVLWEASSAFNIEASNARTGKNYFHHNQASTSNKYVFSPVLTTTTLQNSTAYMIQFWYRVPATLSANTATPISVYGWTSLNGGTGGTGTTATATTLALNAASSVGDWKLFTGSLTTTSTAPSSSFAGLKITNPQAPYFDIDDYVVYPGNAADITAPSASRAPTAIGNKSNNTISVSWTAPSTGVDNGGYVVVRSTSNTPPVPNPNGIYIAGNTMGTENYVVAFIGNSTSFTDGGILVNPDSTYYYHVFTVDKAYNYAMSVSSDAVKINSNIVNTPVINLVQSLQSFSQMQGTASTTQSFTISGNYLTSSILLTPPVGYELSINGTDWFTSTNPLILVSANGLVASTQVSIRLNATVAGSYGGNVTVISNGAVDKTFSVTGNCVNQVIPYNPAPATTKSVVAKDGTGQFSTIQGAIDAAPTNSASPYIIYIKNGKYNEKVSIPSNKPFIHLVGESVAGTIISWDDYSGKVVNGVTLGTSTSATLTVKASDFFMSNITVENRMGYLGDGPQSLAISLEGDRNVVRNCRFISGQDTVLANGNGKRQYFKNCYIDGNTDFIFGSSTAVFDSCVIFPRDRVDGSPGGYITAANTPAGQAYGYVFKDCKITRNRGITAYTLGRPWQNDASTADASKSNNKVVFLNTTMGASIKPEGWSVWDAGTNTALITYAEYKSKNFDGTNHDITQRVGWSKQLTATEAANYTLSAIFNGWDPCTLSDLACISQPQEIAISNFRSRKGTSSVPSFFSWNISWPMTGIKYEVFRSSDKIIFNKVNEQIALNDTAVNFIYSDAIPAPGGNYYYFVKASKEGYIAHVTDTVTISSTPTINLTGTFSSFLQGMGQPSANQAVVVSGENLTDKIIITVPNGFEMSSTGGITWQGSSGTIELIPAAGAVNSTNILLRLNSNTAGAYNGKMNFVSSGASSKSLDLTGTVQNEPLPIFKTLAYYPFTQHNLDSLPFRDAGISPGAFTLKNMALSNGSVISAYSSLLGVSFAPSLDGSGYWTTAYGGYGNNLNRTLYAQVVIKAQPNYSVRVDSLVMNTSLYAASTGKVSVVYSKSGFVSDSADVTGGSSLGMSYLSTANGAFNTPVILSNESNSTAVSYQFALAEATGITLAAGDSICIRLYYSTGSGSPGRYAKVKDLYIKGLSTVILNPTIKTTANLTAFSQTIGNASAVQSYTLSGTDLKGAVVLTPPSGYELSINNSSWTGSSNPLNLPVTNGVLAATTLYVRLNAVTAGTYGGNILHVSTGASNVNLAVNGIASINTAVTNLEAARAGYKIRPNPATNEAWFISPANDGGGQLILYNVLGAKIGEWNKLSTSAILKMEFAHLKQGTYFLYYLQKKKRYLIGVTKL